MINIIELNEVKDIVRNMYDIIYNNSRDAYLIYSSSYFRSFGNLTLQEAYNFVKNIPYSEDKIEIIGRPLKFWQLFKEGYLKGLDCKKKAILMGIYASVNKIPQYLKVISTRKDKKVHHIFNVFKINNKLIDVDATYYFYKIGEVPYKITYSEVY